MHNLAGRLQSSWWGLGLALLLGTVFSACGPIENTSDRARTVDDVVTLLQDLDQHAAWDTVNDALDTLDEQGAGYVAQIRLSAGTVSPAGDLETLDQDVTLTLRMDAQHNAQIELVTGGESRVYFLEGIPGSTGQYRVYRVANARYSCIEENDENLSLHAGLHGIFDSFAVKATGVRMLTIADEGDERTLIERDATHYELKSRLPDALRLLEQLGNLELKARIEQSGTFELSGDLDLDQETGALLHFASVYTETDPQRRTQFSFEVTQWGSTSDFSPPTNEMIAQPCPTS